MHDLDIGHLKMLRDDLFAVESYLKSEEADPAITDLVTHALDHIEEVLGIGIYQRGVS